MARIDQSQPTSRRLTSDDMTARLSGRQLVIVVVAICFAIVLAPAGVYAAAAAKVKIVDASNPSRAVKVDSGGRLQTSVSGSVTVSGNVKAAVSGTVSALPAPPTSPVHREGSLVAATSSVVGAVIPAGRNLAITSIQLMFLDAGGWNQVKLIQASPGGTCSTGGTLLKVIANLRMSLNGDVNEQVTFPVPVVQEANANGICVVVTSAMDGQALVDGYTY